jgi:hypothetical protein
VFELLSEEQNLKPTCFRFSERGLETGIPVVHPPRDPFKQMRPYIPIGGLRLVFDKKRGPLYHRKGEKAYVLRADVAVVEISDDRSFDVLRRPSEDTHALVLVNTRTQYFHLKNDTVRPFRGIDGDGEVIRREGDDALVRITHGQYVHVFLGDGRVVKLFLDGELRTRTLPPEEAAHARVENARMQLAQPWAAESRVHNGIIWGIVSLLPLTVNHQEAREHIVAFLKRNDLSDAMKLRIRILLEMLGDDGARSGWFAVKATPEQVPEVKDRSVQLAKRNARRQADVELRSKMRGFGGGGKNKKKNT